MQFSKINSIVALEGHIVNINCSVLGMTSCYAFNDMVFAQQIINDEINMKRAHKDENL